MRTLIPVICPTFCTQKYLTSRSTSALRRSKFSVATRRSPRRLWCIHILYNHRQYTDFRLPTSLSTTGSRSLPCLKKDSLGPHPESQARVESDPLRVPFLRNTLLGRPPPEAATMRPRREAVSKSWSRVTNLPPR